MLDVLVECIYFSFFFFQADDGIRDTSVTGVQTCALPICMLPKRDHRQAIALGQHAVDDENIVLLVERHGEPLLPIGCRSEERRVGKASKAAWETEPNKERVELTQ